MKYSLFSDVTQRRLVLVTDLSGQPVSPDTCTTNYKVTLRNIPEERRPRPEISLSLLREPATGPYHEPDVCMPHFTHYSHCVTNTKQKSNRDVPCLQRLMLQNVGIEM
jgi:hypothetical protein